MNEAHVEMVDFYQTVFFVVLRKIVVERVVSTVEFEDCSSKIIGLKKLKEED